MKTLKMIKLIASLFISAILLISCSKDPSTVPSEPITIDGMWVGDFKNTGSPDVYYLSFEIKEVNGTKTLDVRDNPSNHDLITATGVWTLSNDVFDAQFSYPSQPNLKLNYTAEFDKVNGKLKNGTFGVNPSNSDSGTWQMNKQ